MNRPRQREHCTAHRLIFLLFHCQFKSTFLQFVHGCPDTVELHPQPPSLKRAPQHKQLLAASQSERNVEFSSVLHTRGEQTEEECRSAPTHRKANTPAKCQSLREESDLADWCRDGHWGAGGIFSPLCPPQFPPCPLRL